MLSPVVTAASARARGLRRGDPHGFAPALQLAFTEIGQREPAPDERPGLGPTKISPGAASDCNRDATFTMSPKGPLARSPAGHR